MGGCQGTGATFVATSLAFSLGEMTDGVCFVEGPESNRYGNSTLVINQLSLERIGANKLKLYENVNWVIRKDWDTVLPTKDIHMGRYLIYDSPADYRDFDLIIFVVDSLPSRVEASKRKVAHIKEYFGAKTIWVINRNFEQKTKKIENYLGITFDYQIPMEDQENFYVAEFLGKPLQKTGLMKSDVRAAIKSIAAYVITMY